MGGRAEPVVTLRRTAVALSVVAAAAGTPAIANAHPLHTTLTEVSVDTATHNLHLVIRVFADDFGRAVTHRAHLGAQPAAGPAWDGAAGTYMGAAVAIADRNGRPIALRPCGVKRRADLLWICLEGTTSESPREIRGRNAILCDVFDDQVNIVQFAWGTQKHSVLFTRGDGLKRLAS